jgi:predicted RNase H-like nuclease (RuvC/YqgF family)
MRVLLLCAAVLAAKSDADLNPVTRVAQLWEGLALKVKGDGEAEQELYDKYKCWCTKVINSKTASIASNTARIQELTTYIDDLSSGKIELTSERTDLEAEIKQLEKTIEEETTLREKENEDYVAAKEEMDKAILALESAVGTLEAVQVNGTSLSSMSAELKRIAKFGSSFLAKRDVDGLMKALQGQMPEVDYEKLKQDPTFKQKYSSRSGNILDILKDMTATFKDNRDSATEAEETAQTNFDALMSSKNEQLSATKSSSRTRRKLATRRLKIGTCARKCGPRRLLPSARRSASCARMTRETRSRSRSSHRRSSPSFRRIPRRSIIILSARLRSPRSVEPQ